MGKKKKSGIPHRPQHDRNERIIDADEREVLLEWQSQERIALEAIYADDYRLVSNGRAGASIELRISPHSSIAIKDASASSVAVVNIRVRHGHLYPAEPPIVEVIDALNIATGDRGKIVDIINAKIEEVYSEEPRVLVFDICEAVQAFLVAVSPGVLVGPPESAVGKGPTSVLTESASSNALPVFHPVNLSDDLATLIPHGAFLMDDFDEEEFGAWETVISRREAKNVQRRPANVQIRREHGLAAGNRILPGEVILKRDIVAETGLPESTLPQGLKSNLLSVLSNGSSSGFLLGRSDSECLKADMLVGHFIQIICKGLTAANGGVTSTIETFKSTLLAELNAIGFVPSWLKTLLNSQPSLFDRAFKRLVQREFSSTGTLRGEPVQSFWDGSLFQSIFQNVKAEDSIASLAREVGRPVGDDNQRGGRYINDFYEEGGSGKGGFGTVFRCRNKLDGRVYAVKKIPLGDLEKMPMLFSKVMREVHLLSNLQHVHVVRYYQAWIESHKKSFDSNGSATSEIRNGCPSPENSLGSLTSPILLSSSCDDAGYIKRESISSSRKSASNIQEDILYIQMEFCPMDLSQWLDIRSRKDSYVLTEAHEQESWSIFRQLMSGLKEIHKYSIVHRDLKPSNVLFDTQGTIKIADFGLSVNKSRRDKIAKESSLSNQHEHSNPGSKMTTQVGTYLYAAPEINSNSEYYDSKVDLYSCGIILVELFTIFETSMERIHVLSKIRNATSDENIVASLPEQLKSFPNAFGLVKLLLRKNPSARPSCEDVLSMDFLPSETANELIGQLNRYIKKDHTLFGLTVKSIFEGAHYHGDRGSDQSKVTKDNFQFDHGNRAKDLLVGTTFSTDEFDFCVHEKIIQFFRRCAEHVFLCFGGDPLRYVQFFKYENNFFSRQYGVPFGPAYPLLNQDGNIFFLAEDLQFDGVIRQFLMNDDGWVFQRIRNNLESLGKFFQFGEVFSKNLPEHQNRSFRATFDIVGTSHVQLGGNSYVELCHLVLQFISTVCDSRASIGVEIRFSHEHISSAVWNYILKDSSLDVRSSESLIQFMEKFHTRSFDKLRPGLDSIGISYEQMQRIKLILEIVRHGDVAAVAEMLVLELCDIEISQKNLLRNSLELCKNVSSAVNFGSLSPHGAVTLNPFQKQSAKFGKYDLTFRVFAHRINKSAVPRASCAVAVCNSYGPLINRCISGAGYGPEYCAHDACGVTIFLDEFARFYRELRSDGGSGNPRIFEGIVAPASKLSMSSIFVLAQDDTTPLNKAGIDKQILFREWQNVLCHLRSSGIRAESGYDPSALNVQYDICQMRGCKLVVIIYMSKILEARERLQGGPREATHGCTPTLTVKIKSLHGFLRKSSLIEDDEISVEEIVHFIKRVL